MALQSSGAISISQIKAELGSSSNSLRTLSSEAGFGTPDAMSEFYGYSAGPPPTPEIYWDGSMVFSYTPPGTGSYNSLNVYDWVPDTALVVDYYGTSQYDFTLGSDYTPWDRMINDYATGGGTSNFFIYSGADKNNPGADYMSLYLTPPSGRSFSSIVVAGGMPPNNYSFTAVNYDYSASTIFASYYGNGYADYAYHDLFFDLT